MVRNIDWPKHSPIEAKYRAGWYRYDSKPDMRETIQKLPRSYALTYCEQMKIEFLHKTGQCITGLLSVLLSKKHDRSSTSTLIWGSICQNKDKKHCNCLEKKLRKYKCRRPHTVLVHTSHNENFHRRTRPSFDKDNKQYNRKNIILRVQALSEGTF